MKSNIYIFSNTILSRKDNSLLVETIADTEAIHDADIYENEREGVLLPPPNVNTKGSAKHIPIESVEALYTFGEVRFNTHFFRCMSFSNTPVHIFNYYGKYVGSFIPPKNEGSGELEIVQYQAYLNCEKRLFIAKSIMESAMRNILANIKTYHYSGIPMDEQISTISALIEQARFAESLQELMGLEGNVRSTYYSAWNAILKHEVTFTKRIKNPPAGMINSMISLGNSLLYAVCLTEIYRTRLTPLIGFLHETGDKKHPLVYDISEVFKPIIVDKVIFRTINLLMITENDFQQTDKGLYMKEKPRKKFVEEFENRLSTVIHHKRLNRRISYRSLIRMECYNLINYLNGEINSYEPYRAS